MSKLDSVCVFCGSSPGARPGYAEAARKMGAELAARGLTLVYGGGNVGLMGIVADAALQAGGKVIGIIPNALEEKELAHRGLTQLEVVGSMHERKARMADLASAFIAMPGGMGTFEELFEILTWAQLGFHRKAIGLLNVEGYYARLLSFLDHTVDERFVSQEHRELLLCEETPAALLDRFASYEPPKVDKWLDRGET